MSLCMWQSRRDCVLQPRVARNELPWVVRGNLTNPERVAPAWPNTYSAGEDTFPLDRSLAFASFGSFRASDLFRTSNFKLRIFYSLSAIYCSSLFASALNTRIPSES